MKGVIIILLIIITFAVIGSTSCENKPFTGYIVGKEYVQGHMCHDENYQHIKEAYVHIPVHTTTHTHHHSWQESEFILHVANSEDLRHFNVDSTTWIRTKMLQKITLK